MENKEIEYKGFKAVIWNKIGDKYNPTEWYISYDTNDFYNEREFFYTKYYEQTTIKAKRLLEKIENDFITNVDNFYKEIESVNKDTLLELIEKYALICVGSFDDGYEYIEKFIFYPILEKYNENILKVI